MQINNQLTANQIQSADRPLELKQGELYNAQIKERVSDTEAVIQIRGKEVKATFEDQVPSDDRVTVQVTGQKDQSVLVKTISTEVPKSSVVQPQLSDAKVLQSVGITAKDIPELKQSVQILLDKGMPVTKEAVQELRDFFETAQGTNADKLDTVKALVNKRLEVTQSHLRPIHEALHGRPLNEVLTDLAKEINPEFDLAKNDQKDIERRNTQRMIENSQKKAGGNPAKVVEAESKAISSSSTLTPTIKTEQQGAQAKTTDKPLSELLQKTREFVEKAPDLKQAVEKVRAEIVRNPAIDPEQAQKIEKAASEAVKLQSIGKERLLQALKNAEEQLLKKEQQSQANTGITTNSNTSSEGAGLREATPKEIVKAVKEEVLKKPSLQRSIETVQKQIVDNPKVPVEVANKVKQAIEGAGRLQLQGRITAGKETLINALDTVGAELEAVDTVSKNQPQVKHGGDQAVKIDQPQPEHRPTGQPASEAVKQVKEHIQNEPDLQKALEKVRNLIANNKNVDAETLRSIERMANQANQLEQAGRERITKVLEQVEKALKQLELHSSKINQPPDEQQTNKNLTLTNQNEEQQNNTIKNTLNEGELKSPEKSPSEIIKQALSQIQKEPNLERALNQIRQEIISSPNLDLKTIEKIDKAIEHSLQLLDKGRELGSRQQITNTLAEVKQELAKTEPKIISDLQQKAPQDIIEQFDLNDQLQALPLHSKNILVTKVTQKLAQATHDFRELKREITRNLDNVERLVNLFKKNAYPQAKQILETTINKLDNAILKSDMMLFTDMKTEKQLMQASTQLADAKKLLAKGNHTEAAKIVHDIKTLIDKINFKPSEQKVMHFVSKESMNLEQKSPQQQLLNHFDETARSYVRQEPSARQMYEMVRSLGLNHDSDLAKSLVFQKGGESPFQQGQDQQNQQQQENLKAALLKLAQTGGDEQQTKLVQQAEQALNNLTGQQLLSKSDSGNSLQSMFFNLPLLLGEKPENLQVFVNSKNQGQQVDWENCNLYFLIETRRLGDVGIMLSTTERNLSITIKNDKPGFKQKMEPIAAITKEKLQEIGYNVNSINFTRMTPKNSQLNQNQDGINTQQEPSPNRPVFTEKGMDFKI